MKLKVLFATASLSGLALAQSSDTRTAKPTGMPPLPQCDENGYAHMELMGNRIKAQTETAEAELSSLIVPSHFSDSACDTVQQNLFDKSQALVLLRLAYVDNAKLALMSFEEKCGDIEGVRITPTKVTTLPITTPGVTSITLEDVREARFATAESLWKGVGDKEDQVAEMRREMRKECEDEAEPEGHPEL